MTVLDFPSDRVGLLAALDHEVERREVDLAGLVQDLRLRCVLAEQIIEEVDALMSFRETAHRDTHR